MDLETLRKENHEQKLNAQKAAARAAMSSGERHSSINRRAAELAHKRKSIADRMELISQAVFGESKESERTILLGYSGSERYFAQLVRQPDAPLKVAFIAEDEGKSYRPASPEHFYDRFEGKEGNSAVVFQEGFAQWELTADAPDDMEDALEHAAHALKDNEDTMWMLWDAVSLTSHNPEVSQRLAALRALQ